MFISFKSACVFLLICVFNIECQLYEGSLCIEEKEGITGTCVSIKNCLSIVYDLKQKKHPQICSFRGREPIVCCTDCEVVNDTSTVLVDKSGGHYFKTGPKVYDKCLEYMVSLDYPCSSKLGLIRYMNKLSDKKCYKYEEFSNSVAVGGINALKDEFPHMALLGYGNDLQSAQWLCGGSVISERFILTAAHCIGSELLGPVKFVALGILKRSDSFDKWQTYNVKRIIPYPQYNPPSKYHDIALLEVDKKIKFSRSVLPACLYTPRVIASTASATGWGALGHRKGLADTLQVIQLQKYTNEECSAAYPSHRLLLNGYDEMTQLCYGDRQNVIDTCEGDSGGPLQVDTIHGRCIYQIIGVTSYGRPCGVQGAAGMYTRVSYYVPWIESIVWP